MEKKNIFILTIVILIACAFAGYFLFFKENKAPLPKSQIVKRKIENKIKSIPKTPSIEKKEPEKNESLTKKEKESAVPEIKVIKKKKETPELSWTEKIFVTSFFIEDLCKFILSCYYPSNSINNPSNNPLLKLDFKVINARYGLELVGFRIQVSDIKKARKKILTYLMEPKALESIYAKYSELFVKELYEIAINTKRVFLNNGVKTKRYLNQKEISELFNLLADYLTQISKILSSLSNNPDIFSLIKIYIKAQKDSIHFNFILNQITNEYKLLLNEKNPDENKLEKIRKKKQNIIQKYKEAIQKRESIRKQVLAKIKKGAKNLTIEDHEILYIAEWLYRRFSQKPNIKVLITGAHILDDMSFRLKEKAKELIIKQ